MVTGDDVGLLAVVRIRDGDAQRAHDTSVAPLTRAHPSQSRTLTGEGTDVWALTALPRWRAAPDLRGHWAWLKAKEQPALSLEALGHCPSMRMAAASWVRPEELCSRRAAPSEPGV